MVDAGAEIAAFRAVQNVKHCGKKCLIFLREDIQVVVHDARAFRLVDSQALAEVEFKILFKPAGHRVQAPERRFGVVEARRPARQLNVVVPDVLEELF
jgi:hypothetical protein